MFFVENFVLGIDFCSWACLLCRIILNKGEIMENQKDNQFDEVEYFTDIAKLRYAIANMEKKFGLVDDVQVKYNAVFPSYGRIAPDGAFGVGFSGDRYPDVLYTPYGEIKINPGVYNNQGVWAKHRLFALMKQKFGLVLTEPSLGDKPNEIGSRYTITKLPWKENQKLPLNYTKTSRQFKFESVYPQVAVLRHVEQIQDQVNEKFLQDGHPELVITRPQKKSHLAIANNQIDESIILKA